jgi:ATP-dependent DNA ligase
MVVPEVTEETPPAKLSGAVSAPMPEHIRPMLGVLSGIPSSQERYAFEDKWDGIRAISFSEGGVMRG